MLEWGDLRGMVVGKVRQVGEIFVNIVLEIETPLKAAFDEAASP